LLVEWLFKNTLEDGGQFTGVSDLLTKYGVVPAEVMVETNSSNNTGRMSNLIGLKLKEFGLELREMSAKKASAADLEKKKTEMLGTVYRILALNLGEPPTKFTWTRKDAKGKPVETKEYTPQSFYQEYIGKDLKNGYALLMNDPSREYYKLYEIDFDRHVYDGTNWTYVNLPIEDIKEMGLMAGCNEYSWQDKLNGLQDTYKYMLHYRMEGIQDPMQEQIYKTVLSSAYELADMLHGKLLAKESPLCFYSRRRIQKTQKEVSFRHPIYPVSNHLNLFSLPMMSSASSYPE
jgi:aminopeptidase C